MKHEDFRKVAVGEAFDVIEARILPSLVSLIEAAAAAEPSAGLRANELRTLARELEILGAMIESGYGALPSTDAK